MGIPLAHVKVPAFNIPNGDEKMCTQACMYCGKLLKVKPTFSGLVYCKICGEDGKNRKREYQER